LCGILSDGNYGPLMSTGFNCKEQLRYYPIMDQITITTGAIYVSSVAYRPVTEKGFLHFRILNP